MLAAVNARRETLGRDSFGPTFLDSFAKRPHSSAEQEGEEPEEEEPAEEEPAEEEPAEQGEEEEEPEGSLEINHLLPTPSSNSLFKIRNLEGRRTLPNQAETFGALLPRVPIELQFLLVVGCP